MASFKKHHLFFRDGLLQIFESPPEPIIFSLDPFKVLQVFMNVREMCQQVCLRVKVEKEPQIVLKMIWDIFVFMNMIDGTLVSILEKTELLFDPQHFEVLIS